MVGCNWLEGDMSKASRSTDNIYMAVDYIIDVQFVKIHQAAYYLILYFPMLYFNFKIQKKLTPYSVPPPQKKNKILRMIADSAGFFYWPFSQAFT